MRRHADLSLGRDRLATAPCCRSATAQTEPTPPRLSGQHFRVRSTSSSPRRASAQVTSVIFYLDGKIVRTEKQAPFDLEGGIGRRRGAARRLEDVRWSAHNFGDREDAHATTSLERLVRRRTPRRRRPRGHQDHFHGDRVVDDQQAWRLLVSASADRHGGAALTGQELTGSQYIFVTTPSKTHVSSVLFYVDGKQVSERRRRRPTTLPVGVRKGQRVQGVGAHGGEHTVTAVVTAGGKTTTLTGTFMTTAVDRTDCPPSPRRPPPRRRRAHAKRHPSAPSQPAPTTVPTTSPAPSPTPTQRSVAARFTPIRRAARSTRCTSTGTASAAPRRGLRRSASSGDLVLRTAGQIQDRVSSSARIVAQATGVSLSNCSIGSFTRDADASARRTARSTAAYSGPAPTRLDHNFITSQSDGIDPTARPKVIQYNKIWRDGTRVGDKHIDGIQFTTAATR